MSQGTVQLSRQLKKTGKEHVIRVGIFWFYQDQLIAKSADVAELQVDSVGLIDSPFQHITEWETYQLYLPKFQELSASEYQEYPRGRVVFSETKNRATVYMDRSLFCDAYKQQLKTHFELTNCRITWKADPHYRVFGSLDY